MYTEVTSGTATVDASNMGTRCGHGPSTRQINIVDASSKSINVRDTGTYLSLARWCSD